jgi:hypothetical protein
VSESGGTSSIWRKRRQNRRSHGVEVIHCGNGVSIALYPMFLHGMLASGCLLRLQAAEL